MIDSQRWERVCAQLAEGEALSSDDARWVDEVRATDPACAAELEFIDELGRWDEGAPPPSASTSAAELVRKALADLDRVDTGASPQPAPRRLWIVVPVVAAAAAIVLAVLLVRDDPAPSSASVVVAHGDVFLDGRPLVQSDAALVDGTTLAVGDGGACLRIDDRIDVCLDAATTATIRGLGEDAQAVEVLRGRAVARLDPLADGRSFALVHDDVSAKAIGTVFALGVDAEGDEVSAAVLQGVVWVAVAGDGIELGAHEVAVVREGAIERTTLAAEREAADLALLAAARELPNAEVGRLVVDCTPAATVVIDGEVVGRSPVVANVSAGQHRVQLVAQGATAVEEALHVDAGETTRRRFELGRDTVAKVDPPVEAPTVAPEEEIAIEIEAASPDEASPTRKPKRSATVLLAEARRERQAGRFDAAARAYTELVDSHPRSTEALTALVSLGDLQLDRLGKPGAAARTYGRYLARGGGPLAQEARYGRVRAYRATGDRTLEARAIEAYIEHHPTSARVGGLKARLGDLGR